MLANQALLSLLADPVVQQLLTNPTLLSLVTNPAVQQLLANPELVSLALNPAVPAILGDPAVQQLLVDPDGSLLPTFPVEFQRFREVVRTEGDVLFLEQDFTDTLWEDAQASGTALDRPSFSSTATLAVDRETREYVSGGSEPRIGGFAFPFDIKKDEQYAIWIHEVWDAPLAKFVEPAEDEEDEVDGLKVYIFRIAEEGLVLPPEPKIIQKVPESLPLTASVVNVTKTEPKTGITVDVESNITYRLQSEALGNPVVFKGSIRYSDASIATSVDDARDARRLLFWFGVFMPWTFIGLGIVLMAGGGGLLGLGAFNKGEDST